MKARHKFRAVATIHDGRRFDSKREAAHAAHLDMCKRTGMLLHYHRQVPIELPGGNVYRVDFLCFWADRTCTYEEVKGMETQAWKIKERLLREAYPHIDLKVIR